MFSVLSDQLAAVLSEQFGVEGVVVGWERPQDMAHGDIATPVALQLAKQAGKSPREIAEALVASLQELAEVQQAEVAGPGYVNVWLAADVLIEALGNTREACTAQVKRDEAPVIVEYSQPNIAKPLGVHHLLSTLIGQAIANLYEHTGYNTLTWNYLGDWGTQFGKLAVAIETFGDGREVSEYSINELLDLYVRFHQEAESNTTLEDEGREAFRKLEAGDTELSAVRDAIVATTKASLHDLYQLLHVSFDLDIGEAFYQDKMQPVIEEGVDKKVFVEGEGGALIVEFPEESNMPPFMVRKGDGATLYSTRDIAQMQYRMQEFSPQEILIVTDIAQKLHFEQLVATCEQLDWELPAFENVLVGRMRFSDKSMSTRKGNVLKLEEVLHEAVTRAEQVIAEHGDRIQAEDPKELAEMMGIGAVAYGIVSQNRKQDLVFDWDKMLSFDGNSAPYLQYTHARARSVVAKSDQETFTVPAVSELTDKERALVNTLLQFERVLEEARASHMPHILANYLFELCQRFNSFYNDETILQAEEPARSLRLYVTDLTASVLKTGASLLTIRVPDRM